MVGLAGCSGGGGASAAGGIGAAAKKGGTVYNLSNADFSHLDPSQGFDGGVNNFFRLIYRTLTMRSAGPTGTKVVPDLATDLGKSSDGAKTWTFQLKDRIFFQDGKPITSQDIKYGVERAFDPEVGIGSPYAKKYLANPGNYQGPYKSKGDLASVQTPDPKTIVFHLNQPVADFASVVSQNTFTPVPRDAGVTAKSLDAKPIASGPYQVKSYQRGSTLELVRNTHWDPSTDTVRKAYPDRWVWRFGLDGATIDQRMISGQGDDADAVAGKVQAATIPRIQTPDIADRTLSLSSGCTTYMGLNTTKPHLNDVRVRQAISYAIDKKSLQDVSGGTRLADIATHMLPPGTPGLKEFDVFPSPNNTGDLVKAKALLAAAGVPKGFGLTMDIRNQPAMQAQAESIQQALARVGITVTFNIIDTGTFYETIGTPSQQHDAAITGWCPDWPGGTTFLPPLFDGRNITAKGNSNLAQIDNPAINARIDQISRIPDVAQQNAAYGELDEQILQQAPVVPLLFEKVVLVLGANIGGAGKDSVLDGGLDLVRLGLKDPK